jgi:hypothetical protein
MKVTTDETLKGGNAFEEYTLSHSVRVERYHADNGIFKARQWVEHVRDTYSTRESLLR